MHTTPSRIVGFLSAAVLTAGASVITAQPAQALGLAGCENGYKEKTCVYVDGIDKEVKKYAFRDSIENSLSYAISGKCAASTSTTFTLGLSIELSGTYKGWVIAEVSASVTGSVQNSTTTGYVTSATFKIPARDVVYCDRGTVVDYFHGRRVRTLYGSEGSITTTTAYSGHAPEAARWWIH